jgi:preprotein translocase subunit SecF
MQIFKNPNFDFLRWRWHALVVSAVVIAAGLGLVATRGLPLGIDFSGGTSLIIEFSEEVSLDRVRDAVASLPGDEVIQRYGEPEQNQVLIRLAQEEGAEEGASLEQGSLAAEQALRDAGLPTFEVVNRRLVGPTIGADLQRRGIYGYSSVMIREDGRLILRSAAHCKLTHLCQRNAHEQSRED